jgi:aminomethyltransferase
MDGILFRLDEDRFWYVHPDGDLDTWLLAHQVGFDVSISDPHSRALQLQGPKSFEIMHAASNGDIDSSMRYFHAGFFNLGGQRLYVSRTGWTGELGFEIYTQGDKTDCPRLWKHLMDIGTPNGMVFSSMQSMNIRRIEAGILDSGSDFDTSMTPYEAGLGKFIELNNKRFIGRDALLNAKRGKRLYGLRCSGFTPSGGDAIYDGNIQVGRVTTGAQSPYLDAGIGYTRFNQAGDWNGKTFSIRSANQGTAECDIVELPFYDQEKAIPRTLTSLI